MPSLPHIEEGRWVQEPLKLKIWFKIGFSVVFGSSPLLFFSFPLPFPSSPHPSHFPVRPFPALFPPLSCPFRSFPTLPFFLPFSFPYFPFPVLSHPSSSPFLPSLPFPPFPFSFSMGWYMHVASFAATKWRGGSMGSALDLRSIRLWVQILLEAKAA